MSALRNFNFDGKPARVVDVDGDALLVGKDVAERLGYSNPTKAMKDHCRGVTKRYPNRHARGRMQEVGVLTEAAVRRLIIASKLPSAEQFERWVFEEVLPAIRRTGRYEFSGGADGGLNSNQTLSENPAADPAGYGTPAFADKMRVLELAEEHFGEEGFRRAWESMGFASMAGLVGETPARHRLPEPVPLFMPLDRNDASQACLRHMLNYQRRRTTDRICDIIRQGLAGGYMFHPLKSFGIRITGPVNGDASGIVVQARSKGMKNVFGGTPWYDYAWIEPLSRLPGAARRKEPIRPDSGAKFRDVVFLPAALVSPQLGGLI